MADAKMLNIDDNTPEYVAYKLLQDVMAVEDKSTFTVQGRQRVDRKYLLDTYAECILAVTKPFDREQA